MQEPTQEQIDALRALMGPQKCQAMGVDAAAFNWLQFLAIIQALLAALSTKQGVAMQATLGFDWGKLFSFLVSHWQEILDIFKPTVTEPPVNVP